MCVGKAVCMGEAVCVCVFVCAGVVVVAASEICVSVMMAGADALAAEERGQERGEEREKRGCLWFETVPDPSNRSHIAWKCPGRADGGSLPPLCHPPPAIGN